MKRILMIFVAVLAVSATAFAGDRDGRVSFGIGLLYENGLDATLSYERENAYHNAWEFFANGYLKWDKCASCGHVCPDSFWKNYSDTHRVLGGVHAGYEHNYRLRGGWQVYWQVKSDLMIKGKDLFRTGIVLGVKLPVK